MSIKYKIFPDHKLVYVVGKGQIEFDDLLYHIQELSENPEYIPPMKKLVDYRNSTLSKLTSSEAQKFTDKKAQLKDKFRNEICAFVTTTDLDFGMSRVHGANIESSQITTNVFRKVEDALSWLQIELDEIEMNFG
jgi:hypothetical protein